MRGPQRNRRARPGSAATPWTAQHRVLRFQVPQPVIGPPVKTFAVDNPDELHQQLDTLTDALDIPGADLQAMLDVLIDDVTAAVPSFLGLQLTVTAGEVSTTLRVVDPHLARAAHASLRWPLQQLRGGAPTNTAILYAAQPGAFTALAGSARRAVDRDGQVVIDGNLPAGGHEGIQERSSSIGETELINTAIGVLIGQGHLPEDALGELTRRATQHHSSLPGAAEQLLASV
jgi:hypothetical protein